MWEAMPSLFENLAFPEIINFFYYLLIIISICSWVNRTAGNTLVTVMVLILYQCLTDRLPVFM